MTTVFIESVIEMYEFYIAAKEIVPIINIAMQNMRQCNYQSRFKKVCCIKFC